MKLNFRTIGEGTPLIVMHGVFGSADNWQTVGKVLAQTHKVYLVDLRNHGGSPHSDVFNYDVMAEDILELMADEQLQEACLLGHSMGGKVAMTFATKYPDRVSKLIVVDIAPREYPPHHQQIFKGFHAVKLDSLSSRSEADQQLSEVIGHSGIRQFILKNLTRDKEGLFHWKLNLAAIEKAASRVGSRLAQDASFEKETLFIGGDKSDYIQETDKDEIKRIFPASSLSMIQGAGHWVHAEKPKELIQLVSQFLAQ